MNSRGPQVSVMGAHLEADSIPGGPDAIGGRKPVFDGTSALLPNVRSSGSTLTLKMLHVSCSGLCLKALMRMEMET